MGVFGLAFPDASVAEATWRAYREFFQKKYLDKKSEVIVKKLDADMYVLCVFFCSPTNVFLHIIVSFTPLFSGLQTRGDFVRGSRKALGISPYRRNSARIPNFTPLQQIVIGVCDITVSYTVVYSADANAGTESPDAIAPAATFSMDLSEPPSPPEFGFTETHPTPRPGHIAPSYDFNFMLVTCIKLYFDY
jgi:hypothetical protein